MENLRKTIGFFEQESGQYDIEIDEKGDFRTDNSFDTEINISLKSDRRASSSEMSEPERRRGWEGDVVTTLQDYQIGSKIWLTEQGRWTQQTANDLASDAQSALQHFVERNLCERVQTDGTLIDVNGIIEISVLFYVDKNVVKKFTAQIWGMSLYARGN